MTVARSVCSWDDRFFGTDFFLSLVFQHPICLLVTLVKLTWTKETRDGSDYAKRKLVTHIRSARLFDLGGTL